MKPLTEVPCGWLNLDLTKVFFSPFFVVFWEAGFVESMGGELWSSASIHRFFIVVFLILYGFPARSCLL